MITPVRMSGHQSEPINVFSPKLLVAAAAPHPEESKGWIVSLDSSWKQRPGGLVSSSRRGTSKPPLRLVSVLIDRMERDKAPEEVHWVLGGRPPHLWAWGMGGVGSKDLRWTIFHYWCLHLLFFFFPKPFLWKDVNPSWQKTFLERLNPPTRFAFGMLRKIALEL